VELHSVRWPQAVGVRGAHSPKTAASGAASIVVVLGVRNLKVWASPLILNECDSWWCQELEIRRCGPAPIRAKPDAAVESQVSTARPGAPGTSAPRDVVYPRGQHLTTTSEDRTPAPRYVHLD
jgi:hypothetical protein